jgi:hypothetical protein
MKLATFSNQKDGQVRLGAVCDSGVVDLSRSGLPVTMIELLAAGDAAMDAAGSAVAAAP